MKTLPPSQMPPFDRPADYDPQSDDQYEMRPVPAGGIQGTLFASDEIVLPESVRSMRKAVSAIHAVPLKAGYSPSLNHHRLFDACIIVAQLDCRNRDSEFMRRVREDRVSPAFEVRISDLARLARIPGKNYQRIYRELDELADVCLSWNVVGEDSTVEWAMKARFFSLLGIGKGNRQGFVRFAFDPELLAIFLEPTLWAKLSLDVMGGLKTPASYALYQNSYRYVNTHQKITAALPTHIWVELLVGQSYYVTEREDGSKHVNYGDFKRRVLLDAIRRVNECEALSYTLELREIFSGKKVAKLQFKLVPKEARQTMIPLGWPTDALELLGQLGYTQQAIKDMSEAHSYEEIADALRRLETAEKIMREKGRKIGARRPYFEGILRNITMGVAEERITDAAVLAEIRAQEAQQAAADRLSRLKTQFDTHQRERFAAWFGALEDEERKGLVVRFLASPKLTAGERFVLKNGFAPGSLSAQALLRTWLSEAEPLIFQAALPHPQDREFEAWMAWRLSGGDVIEG